MKIAMLALAAVILAPVISFACPPPPAPGYKGPDGGSGPRPSDSGGVRVDKGGKDSNSGSTSKDCTIKSCCM